MAMKIALTSQAITDHITLLWLEENTEVEMDYQSHEDHGSACNIRGLLGISEFLPHITLTLALPPVLSSTLKHPTVHISALLLTSSFHLDLDSVFFQYGT